MEERRMTSWLLQSILLIQRERDEDWELADGTCALLSEMAIYHQSTLASGQRSLTTVPVLSITTS
jgi:hypothetical protein